MLRRIVFLFSPALFALLTWQGAAAQDPGPVADARVSLLTDPEAPAPGPPDGGTGLRDGAGVRPLSMAGALLIAASILAVLYARVLRGRNG